MSLSQYREWAGVRPKNEAYSKNAAYGNGSGGSGLQSYSISSNPNPNYYPPSQSYTNPYVGVQNAFYNPYAMNSMPYGGYNSNNYSDAMIRASKAREVNIRAKQALVTNMILKNSSLPTAGKSYANYGQSQHPPPNWDSSMNSNGKSDVDHSANEHVRESESSNATSTKESAPVAGTSSKQPDPHIKGDNDDDVAYEKEKSKNKADAYDKKLTGLSQDIARSVQDYNKALQKDADDLLSDEKRRQNAKKEATDKTKNIMENLIKRSERKNKNRKPLWRHRLAGLSNPPPDLLITGPQLFRAVVKAIIGLIIRPRLLIFHRKTSTQTKERRVLSKTLNVLSDSITEWMGKLVQVPVSTLVQVNNKTKLAD